MRMVSIVMSAVLTVVAGVAVVHYEQETFGSRASIVQPWEPEPDRRDRADEVRRLENRMSELEDDLDDASRRDRRRVRRNRSSIARILDRRDRPDVFDPVSRDGGGFGLGRRSDRCVTATLTCSGHEGPAPAGTPCHCHSLFGPVWGTMM